MTDELKIKSGSLRIGDVAPDFEARTTHGPMLYASSAILDSNSEGSSRGTFVMGRFVTPELIETLTERTHNRRFL